MYVCLTTFPFTTYKSDSFFSQKKPTVKPRGTARNLSQIIIYLLKLLNSNEKEDIESQFPGHKLKFHACSMFHVLLLTK